MDSAPRLDGYTDYFWNAALGHYQARTQAAVSVGAAGAGFYPVRPPSELFLWLSPALGLQLNTIGLSHSLHLISVHFVDAAGAAIASSAPLTIMVNNQSCVASIGLSHLGRGGG